jgi:hypothetical protein
VTGARDFYDNFAVPSVIAGNAIQLQGTSAANAAGDLNSTYFQFYYSLKNLAVWEAQTGYCLELVLVGDFPEVRYFTVAVNDEHYSLAQHILDADIDPAVSEANGGYNPFTPNQPNPGTYPYLVPISLGQVPAQPPGTARCGITPYEGDNLLDATQRHLSMDWNTNVNAPNVPSSGLDPHVVDDPTHASQTYTNALYAAPNGAGEITVRAYLPPYSCSGTLGEGPPNGYQCSPNPAVSAPYLLFRDVGSGCAFSLSYVEENLLNDPAYSADVPETAAVVSTSDPSSATTTDWLSTTQKSDHTNDADLTPQACYANGDPTQLYPNPPSSGPPTFYNRVPWARAPQWNGTPGPDDAYVGGAISETDLTNIISGSDCNSTSSAPCVIRMRFQLPTMPSIPLSGTLSGSEQLRYWSLTFWQQQPGTGSVISDIDGLDPPPGGPVAVSFVSLADPALTATNGYVTLLVNVGKTADLPSWLKSANGTQIPQGLAPGSNSYYYYSAWNTTGANAGYNVVDLNGFTNTTLAHPFNKLLPLLMTIRTNLPNGFYCSGSALPFSAADYIGAGGMLGPYIPLVDYLNPNDQTGDAYSLPATPPTLTALPLPSGSSCTTVYSLPASYPGFNAPTANLDWPNQPWPSESGNSLPLVCSSGGAHSPAVDFVATQFPTPVDDSSILNSPQNCTNPFASNLCTQLIAQGGQTTELPGGWQTGASTWQPPTPITIVGSGFGFMAGLPLAVPAGTSPSYLTVHDTTAGWSTADSSADCQVYIANWTDTSISFLLGLPVGETNMYGTTLSPLADVSPITLSGTGSAGGPVCTVAGSDTLRIIVTNPQSGNRQVLPFFTAYGSSSTPF